MQKQEIESKLKRVLHDRMSDWVCRVEDFFKKNQS